LYIYPEGGQGNEQSYVAISYTSEDKQGLEEKISYDYLINAIGPKLKFEATAGLGRELGNCNSVYTYQHAEHTWKNLTEVFKKMKSGEKQTIVIGTGHSMATCQGAAFEYVLNIAFEVRKRNLEDFSELIWLTNEYEVGDFGMGGAYVKRNGYITSTTVFAESMLAEYGIRWITRAGVQKVEKNTIHYENLDGEQHEQPFDFSMLIPAFSGVGLT
jgi:sulfide:quinone oxidoreductase